MASDLRRPSALWILAAWIGSGVAAGLVLGAAFGLGVAYATGAGAMSVVGAVLGAILGAGSGLVVGFVVGAVLANADSGSYDVAEAGPGRMRTVSRIAGLTSGLTELVLMALVFHELDTWAVAALAGPAAVVAAVGAVVVCRWIPPGNRLGVHQSADA